MAKAPAAQADQADQADQAASSTGFNPANIIEKAHIVVASISLKGLKEGDSLYLKYMSEIREKEQTEEKGPNVGKPKIDAQTGKPQTIHTVNAIDMTTGQFGEVVIGAIVLSAHQKDTVPLTGRCFKWTKGKEETNKATRWTVVEFTVPA